MKTLAIAAACVVISVGPVFAQAAMMAAPTWIPAHHHAHNAQVQKQT